MKFYEKYKTLFEKYCVSTYLRIAHFMAQIKHESGLKPINESLNYSVEALISGFGRHRISISDAKKYGRIDGKQKANQEMLANILYGGKWGLENLGNTEKGDGWKFRGRGFKQITGRANYESLSRDTGIDFVNNPDLLLSEVDAMVSALWFWNKNNLNRYADVDNLDAISDLINLGHLTKTVGDSKGFDKRKLYLSQYKKELGI